MTWRDRRIKKMVHGELPYQVQRGVKGEGDGRHGTTGSGKTWQTVVRGAQGNFDHIMGIIRNIVQGFNLLADDVEEIQDALEGNINVTNEHVAQLADLDEISHDDLLDVSDSDHHAPVTVGTGLDVDGNQLVTLDLSEVSAGGELGGTLDAPTVDASHSGSTHASLAHPDLSTHDALGLATDAELATHAAAADPHTGYILESLIDAVGDLIVGSADNTPARLAKGTDGQVLTVDSTETLDLKWEDPAAGGGGGSKMYAHWLGG